MFLGIYGIDEYVAIPAVTHRFSSGAAYAPSAITYSIYEEGNTTGLDEDVDMTPASPFDSVTGLYYARRQLTAAAGFEANKTYVAVVKATVDSVAAIDAHIFQIRPQQTGDSYAIINGDHGCVSIQDDIDTLLTDWVNGGRLDLLIDSIITHLVDIKGTGFAKDTHSLPQCLTATGFSTFNAASDTVKLNATQSAYAPAKAGDKMDLIDAPNATAIAAVKTALEAAGSYLALIKTAAEAVDALTKASGDGDLAALLVAALAIKGKTDILPSAISKNTALNNFEFVMVLASDHISPATGKTITAERSIDGAAFGACANAVSEVASGVYKINLAASDLNGDVITFKFSEASCDTRFITIKTEAV